MARGLVQPRPFVKPKANSSSFSPSKVAGFKSKKLGKNEFYHFLFNHYIGWISAAIILVFIWLFLLKGTWYNPNYLIQNITYSSGTRAQYENTELFVLTSKYLRGEYLNTIKIWGINSVLSKIQEQYPFVRDLKIKYESPQSISVDFSFHYPKFRVKIWERYRGVWSEKIHEELKSSRALAQTGVTIDTPAYLSGTETLSGFFHEISYKRFEDNVPKIKTSFPNINRLVYLAGSPYLIVFENNKTIYLHRDNLNYQLEKYHQLQKNYSNFPWVFEIDLGSQTQNRVIVKE